MSGIAGIFYLDGRLVEESTLQRMIAILAHRGPDSSGSWIGGKIGLGHRMLWTTPESVVEQLPFVESTGRLAITADARLDNREDLRQALGIPGECPTDSALILKAYDQWGHRCAERLLGDFVFAIWDKQHQHLFCARDHMGIKPFYYWHERGKLFAFASELKALLSLASIPRRLNEYRIADYLIPMLEDKETTFYAGILRLPPGHQLTVTQSQSHMQSFWSLDPARETRFQTDEDYAEAFRDIFCEAVRCRLRSAFPVGSLLSGGLDSSSVTCVARNLIRDQNGETLHAFSVVFDEVPECDERTFINAVVNQGQIFPHYVRADSTSPLSNINQVFWHQDEPFWAPNLFLGALLYNTACAQRVRVLLDGVDGDTTVSHGFVRLTELTRSLKLFSLLTEIHLLSIRFNRPWSGYVKRYVFAPFLPRPLQWVWRILHGRSDPIVRSNPTLRREFAARTDLVSRLHAYERAFQIAPLTVREDHQRRLSSGVIPFFLEVADRAAAAVCIAPAYPFFDRRLVEFCLTLPPEQKLWQGWSRMVMRRAHVDLLPREVNERGGKSNLSPNFQRSLFKGDKEIVEGIIFKDASSIDRYVDIAKLQHVYRRFVEKRLNEDGLTIWKAATLGLWLQRTNLEP